MLSVLSSTPVDQASNVYLDAPIEITFSQEVHDVSLTTENFRIYVMPNWSAQVAILSVQKIGPKVIIATSGNLPASTQLLLWIRGDDNVSDGTPKGVASVIGEVLNGNVQIFFTTGTKVAADDVIAEIPISSETLESIDEPVSESTLIDNEFLDVIGTYPNDGDFNISGLTSLVIKFDQELYDVDLSYGVVNNPVSGIINIEAEPMIFGNTSLIPSILLSDVKLNKNMLIIDVDDNQMSTNTIYTITVFKDYITGDKQQKLPADYVFNFVTKLFPMYASVKQIRSKGGKFIADSIDNLSIATCIQESSLWISQLLGSIQSPPYNFLVIEATIYKTICELLSTIALGESRFIKDKQLADLRVTYDIANMESIINNYCRKATMALSKLGIDVGNKVGIKGIEKSKYPGSKRTVHLYNFHSRY